MTALPVSSRTASYDKQQIATDRTVTILLTTFAGLGLPRTLSLPVTATASVHDVLATIHSRLPPVEHSLIITTTDNKQVLSSSTAPVSSLLSSSADSFLPLRLSARLCGGKGGFGSQLRAAGGRMSSRKKRDQNQTANGSNRNLDGRRIRDVEKAKQIGAALAKAEGEEARLAKEKRIAREEYLAGIEKQLEQVRSGKAGGDRGRLDAEYVEGKEQAEERTRADVIKNARTGNGTSKQQAAHENGAGTTASSSGSRMESVAVRKVEEEAPRPLWGFDEDEDSEDDEDGEGDDEDEPVAVAPMPEAAYTGKGKARAT